MMVIDANTVSDNTILCDVCIIGAGPAGLTVAKKLAGAGRNVVVAESGGTDMEAAPNKFNSMRVTSNFRYRSGRSNRNRQIGGTANIWAGRVVPFIFDTRYDSEWGTFTERLGRYYDEAFRILGIEPGIQDQHESDSRELFGYWGMNTQRFCVSSLRVERIRYRIFAHLTLIGKPGFEGTRLSTLTFVNELGKEISVTSSGFVLAMGGIENSRMLLIMGGQLQPRMGRNFENIGKYVTDHPRISHGRIVRTTQSKAIGRYQMQMTEHGIYKRGIRHAGRQTRVYSNILADPGVMARRGARLRSATFEKSLIRLVLREQGVFGTAAYCCRRAPLLRASPRARVCLDGIFNRRVFDKYRIMTYCEQFPRKENQIVLDREVDRNDLRIPLLRNEIHAEELNEVATFYKELEIAVADMGCRMEYDPEKTTDSGRFTDSAHIMGGTRYSADSKRAVLDENLRVMGISNLYVSGSSVFPTSGVENPTHLIVALSCFLADVLKAQR